MNALPYEIIVKTADGTVSDFVKTFAAAVRFIARETAMMQKEIRAELNAKTSGSFKRDNRGFRVEVYYN